MEAEAHQMATRFHQANGFYQEETLQEAEGEVEDFQVVAQDFISPHTEAMMAGRAPSGGRNSWA